MTPLEKEISGIFTQVLKREPDDLEKSFFDLGGHSLSSVELLYKINHHFKTNHQLSFIFRYPSVKQLAQNLNNGKESSGIVTLKRDESSKALFLIHPAGGNVFSYRYFAGSFEKNINIFGMETVPGDMKYKTIEELAAKYLERLRSYGFKGEIIIGGWSMGALIAYQMATMSKEKYTVVLIDQMAEAIRRHGYQKEEDKILLFARKVEHFIGYKTDITGESIKGKTKKEISAIFLKNFIEAGLVPSQTSPEDFYGFLETMIHHNDMAYKYIPDNYSGKVIVVKSEKPMILDGFNLLYNNRPDDLLWSKYANHIKLINSPGDHVSMMRNPYVKTLVKLLSKEIF
jgi:thioesterase domain-containing protein/acyl carrier protein